MYENLYECDCQSGRLHCSGLSCPHPVLLTVWVGNCQAFIDPRALKNISTWPLSIGSPPPYLRVTKAIEEYLWAWPPSWETQPLGLGMRNRMNVFSHYYSRSDSLSSHQRTPPSHPCAPSNCCPGQGHNAVNPNYCLSSCARVTAPCFMCKGTGLAPSLQLELCHFVVPGPTGPG